MKKAFLFFVLLSIAFSNGFSQQKLKQPQINAPIVRCATDQRVQMLFRKFPERKLLAERLAREVPSNKALRKAARLQAIVYLPVVFHIVLSNPYIVTEELVKSQIDALNADFAGLNADSTNIPAAFQALRGHSQIRFVLAKRTPSGTLTSGIERISSSTTGNPNNVTDSIKRKSLGGADAWNPNSYINIWVGNIADDAGTLGYTQIPGSGVPADDGIFCNIKSFGISNCNVSNYNKGRTVVHEMGHYFGINHIWGDDENDTNKCSGDDFRALTDDGSTYTLPLSLYNPHGKGNTSEDIGDTPNQAIAITNCATGIVTDACSGSAPGILYQDFMDYTMDNCFSMFTNKQVARMEYLLDTYRNGLITSLGGTVPASAPTRDASPIYSVNPGGLEVSGCSSIYHPSTLTCAGNVTPMVLIENKGVNTITSLTVGYRLNGGAPVTMNINPNLLPGAIKQVNFPAVAVAIGNYTFKFFTANVNGGGTDQVPSNDTLSATLNVPNPVALPLSQGFENGVFPPSGWSLINPNNNNTWQLTTPGHNSAHSMFIDNYDNSNANQADEIRTPKINLASADPVIIQFDLAHKNYPDADFNDTLQVLISNDCGATFTIFFNKAGAALSTAGSTSSGYFDPAPGDWKAQKIIVDGSILSSGNIIISFKNISDYGNNIFIDNINITQEKSRDLTVTAINPPSATSCEEPIIPVAIIKNVGFSTITGFKVSYNIDNGSPSQTTVAGISLAPDAQMNVPLNTFTPAGGQHVITVFSTEPISSTGTGDENMLNDTIRKSFYVTGKVDPPSATGFEDPTFPPATWSIENPDGSLTWQRTTSAAKTGNASMVMRNYDYAYTGTTDKFISSLVSGTAAYDSMYVSFDYAYAKGSSSTLADTLELQVTTDCGQTFTTVWKKWGSGLQTSGGRGGGNFVPGTDDWANINLNLFRYVNTQNFQMYFVAKGNRQNNLYIDNINIYGINVPARLKAQGYLIYPNPFRQQFIIRNYEVPVNLESARVYNTMGQLVWSQQFNGNATTEIHVNMSNAPAGVYYVRLFYTDKSIVQKIVKQ